MEISHSLLSDSNQRDHSKNKKIAGKIKTSLIFLAFYAKNNVLWLVNEQPNITVHSSTKK